MADEKPLYHYYSTQRPIDIGTYPKTPENPLVEFTNYDGRMYVEHDTRMAWGVLAYAAPLTKQQMDDYELKPARSNPDVQKRMEVQAEVVYKFENRMHVPERRRITWLHPDFGVLVSRYFTPEQLEERFQTAQQFAQNQREKRAQRAKNGPARGD